MEATLDKEIKEYQDYQKELSAFISSRAVVRFLLDPTNKIKLDSQIQENQMVQKEFKVLAPSSQIYKQIGPVLIKQDRIEAESNVDKRIEFISAELKRLDKLIKDLESKSEKKKMDIVGLQTALQQGTVTA